MSSILPKYINKKSKHEPYSVELSLYEYRELLYKAITRDAEEDETSRLRHDLVEARQDIERLHRLVNSLRSTTERLVDANGSLMERLLEKEAINESQT